MPTFATPTKPGMPIWGEHEQGYLISLVMTPAGRDAIGIESEPGAGAPAEQAVGKPGAQGEHILGGAAHVGGAKALVAFEQEAGGG